LNSSSELNSDDESPKSKSSSLPTDISPSDISSSNCCPWPVISIGDFDFDSGEFESVTLEIEIFFVGLGGGGLLVLETGFLTSRGGGGFVRSIGAFAASIFTFRMTSIPAFGLGGGGFELRPVFESGFFATKESLFSLSCSIPGRSVVALSPVEETSGFKPSTGAGFFVTAIGRIFIRGLSFRISGCSVVDLSPGGEELEFKPSLGR